MLVIKEKLFIASVSVGMFESLTVPIDAADEEEARKIIDMLISPHQKKYKIDLLTEITAVSRFDKGEQ